MDSLVLKHMQDLYGLNPDIPHLAFQFPRLPPGILSSNPMFKIYKNPNKRQFLGESGTIDRKLKGFQQMYQQYASGLLSMNANVIPPGHPLYTEQNSIQTLQAENDRLYKENLKLKKRVESNSDSATSQ